MLEVVHEVCRLCRKNPHGEPILRQAHGEWGYVPALRQAQQLSLKSRG